MTGTQIFSRINAVHEKKSCCKLRNCLAALINGTIVCSVSRESSFYVSPKFFLLPSGLIPTLGALVSPPR